MVGIFFFLFLTRLEQKLVVSEIEWNKQELIEEGRRSLGITLRNSYASALGFGYTTQPTEQSWWTLSS